MSQLNLEIQTKLDALSQALLESHPTIPTLLKDIHRTLKAQPEQVTLMSESELHVVVQGLMKQTNSNLAAAAMKPVRAKKESLKSMTLDELGF